MLKGNKGKGTKAEKRKKDNEDLYDEDGRLDTFGDDDLYDFKDGGDDDDEDGDGEGNDWQDEDKVDVDLEIQKDEDYTNLEKRFNVIFSEDKINSRFKVIIKVKDWLMLKPVLLAICLK